jgi:uncharacterized lipoprotein YmbA
MRRTLIGSTVLLAAALALTGCSAAGGSAGDYAGPESAPQIVDGSAGGDSGEFSSDADAGVDPASAERQVVITGNVTITADEPLTASREAVRIVEAAGGRVDGRTEYAPSDTDKGSAQLTLRIPADKLTSVLESLEKLGTADEVSLSTSDVTVQTQDLDARISSLRASIERLNGLIAQATSIEDLITLEHEISNRQAELESLEAQQRYLSDQVAMSTISLYLRSDAEAPPADPDSFWDGLGAGWGAFVAFWAGLLVVLGVLLPWLITFGLIALIIILIVRGRRRRREAAAAAPAPQVSERKSSSKAKP